MQSQFLAAAEHYSALGDRALAENRVADALSQFEHAFSAAFIARSRLPLAFKLRHPALLPRPLASPAHIIAHLSADAILLQGKNEIVAHPLRVYRRFPMIGEILSRVAQQLPPGQSQECIIDLGDGDDLGDYRRVAFSSRRADTLLILDPYLDLQEDYRALRAMVADYPRWDMRDERVFWRGTPGGEWRRQPDLTETPMRWDWLQRLHLCDLARRSRHSEMLDVGLGGLRQISDPALEAAIRDAGFVLPEVDKADFVRAKYQIDIDGWSNSWSLLEKLIMGALIFKVASPLAGC